MPPYNRELFSWVRVCAPHIGNEPKIGYPVLLPHLRRVGLVIVQVIVFDFYNGAIQLEPKAFLENSGPKRRAALEKAVGDMMPGEGLTRCILDQDVRHLDYFLFQTFV